MLVTAFGYDETAAAAVMKKAKPKYAEIISKLPEFEKEDRFKMNIVNCAMLCAVILSMPERPDVERLTEYYSSAMMTPRNVLVLPQGRKEQVHRKGYQLHEGNGKAKGGGQKPVFVEHGLLRISRRERV